MLCNQCGAEWLDDEISEILETIVEKAKKNNSLIDVREFSASKDIAS